MKVRDLSKGLSVCQGKPWKSGKERCISMVRIRLWMTALPLKPLWETLDHFMLGDNRNNSRDSRMWDNPYVKKEKILGKAVLRYFPGIEVLK